MSIGSDVYPAAKWRMLQEYMDKAIRSSEFDGPDTPYQHGYLDALRAVRKEMEK